MLWLREKTVGGRESAATDPIFLIKAGSCDIYLQNIKEGEQRYAQTQRLFNTQYHEALMMERDRENDNFDRYN